MTTHSAALNHLTNPNFAAIEHKWQQAWDVSRVFEAKAESETGIESEALRPKYYVLEMFPYPSGKMHMGHVRNYMIGDVITRYKLRRGFNVLHPFGWDAFGLPAENAAIDHGVQPQAWTETNIASMKVEMKGLGFAYDWSREICTASPDYYKHEQKIFLDFLNRGIAYKKSSFVNWDPVDQTVLANEQVVDGRGWRSGEKVVRKKLSQWFFKITDYAEELLDNLPQLTGWPEEIRLMQEKWIGKSSGCNIDFKINCFGNSTPVANCGVAPVLEASCTPKVHVGFSAPCAPSICLTGANFESSLAKDAQESIKVFSTLPETIFGGTFVAISFEHPLAAKLVKTNAELSAFIDECLIGSVAEEDLEKMPKLGFDTGLQVENPVMPGKFLPVFVANFVLMEYGTGAIFGCPAHDARDYEFAQRYGLPVVNVLEAGSDSNANSNGLKVSVEPTDIMVNSEFLNGLTSAEAKQKIISYLEQQGSGQGVVNYRLRDWGVSRQRYWGCPIPIIKCDSCGDVPVPEQDLPVTLPADVDFSQNKPGNPLEHHPTWKHAKCPKCGADAVRETDTFDTFVDSAWYFARFCNPNTADVIDSKATDYWLPVDQYIGGAEHAVMHLLYARFFVKAMRDCGYFDLGEPFKGLFNQGMITHMAYQDSLRKWVDVANIVQKNGESIDSTTGRQVFSFGVRKMSKSYKNVVAPAVAVALYGADTVRMFSMSDTPPGKSFEWTDSGIRGVHKFVCKLYEFVRTNAIELGAAGDAFESLNDSQLALRRLTHKTIANFSKFIEDFQFNRAIASIRELTNESFSFQMATAEDKAVVREATLAVISLLNPLTPHITEDMWQQLGGTTLLAQTDWPQADAELVRSDTVQLPVQVNGKLRAVLEVGIDDVAEDAVKALALADAKVQRALDGKAVKKFIYVQSRVINIVI